MDEGVLSSFLLRVREAREDFCSLGKLDFLFKAAFAMFGHFQLNF
jgi:hypothetical protein